MTQSAYLLLTAVFAALLFALALSALVARAFARSKASPLSLSAVGAGVVIVLFAVLAVYVVAKKLLLITGEPLQPPLALALIVSGLVSGLVMSRLTLRVALIESLFVCAFFSLAPVVLSSQLDVLFTYGTSSAYYSALLLTGYLLLFLGLCLGGSLGYLFFGDGRLTLASQYEQWMGRRFLMAKQKNGAVSVITLISTVAVMTGCAGMIVVMSVMNGFSTDLRTKILGANAHIMLLKFGKDFSEYNDVLAKTKKLPGVYGASPFVLNEVMISSETNLSGSIIKGIDVATIGSVSVLPKNIVEGHLDFLDHPDAIPAKAKKSDDQKSPTDTLDDAIAKASQDEGTRSEEVAKLPAIVIGKEMAQALRVMVGDVVNVVSPIGELGPTGPVPKAKAFRVGAVFYSGMYEYDSKFAYIALGSAQAFFGLKTSVTGIEYKLVDIEQTQNTARQIEAMVKGYPYYTKDWMQMNRNLFSALKLEKIVMFIILMALIFMASLLVLVALIMVVLEKGKEIAILKSMGATDTSIMKIFVSYGLIIGSMGAGLGIALGLILCGAISFFGIGLDAEVYYITHIPVRVEPLEIMLVGLGAVIISFFATIPPALFAARLKPVEGLNAN